MRTRPHPQTLHAIIAASVRAEMAHSVGVTSWAPVPSTTRKPARPADQPIMKITNPEISGGKMPRNRLRIGASAASNSPAKIVIPKTSGNPPARAASKEGAKYVAVKVDGHMYPDPKGP